MLACMRCSLGYEIGGDGGMMLDFRRSSLTDNGEFFEEYLHSLSGVYDDFLEDHILASQIYSIYIDNVHCGYFGIYERELLTQFFMVRSMLRLGQRVFKEILSQFPIKSAFVPTCDELFLSHALDCHRKVNFQAYFFQATDSPIRLPAYGRDLLQLAVPADIPEIVAITGDFVNNHQAMIDQGQLYILRENGEFLGLGIVVENRIMKNCCGTGMFTNEKHRHKGVGRSIIIHLRQICEARGKTVVPGCWYYNEASKRTLESAGYVSKTRLLRIEF